MSGTAKCSHKLCIQPHKAIILYPALTTPCLALAGDEISFTVILAAKKSMLELHTQVDKKGSTALTELGEHTLIACHRQLAFASWIDSTKAGSTYEDKRGKSLSLASPKYMIYGNWGSEDVAREKIASKDFSGYYLGQLPASMNEVVKIKDFDGEKRCFGTLHRKVIEVYKEKGYNHLFQLNFKGVKGCSSIGAYELIWIYMDQEEYLDEGERNNLAKYFSEPDDILMNEYIQNTLSAKNPYFREVKSDAGKETKHSSYHLYSKEKTSVVISDGSSKEVSFVNYAGVLHARHPVCVIKNKLPTIGVLSDIHVSSRQTMFKLSRCQVIPGASVDDSPYIGDIAQDYLESFKYLLDTIGARADILTIPGDIYDSQYNCHPKQYVDEIKGDKENARTGRLWHYFDIKTNKDNINIYPSYNDGLMMLSLIHEHYSDKGKAVFFVTGNHEAYERAYGISPRVDVPLSPFGNKISVRANSGIAEEHNLTFYEATLLYGDNYTNSGTKVGGRFFNFSHTCFDWLFFLFSPWHDYVVNHKDSFQLSGLGWGDEESFKRALAGGGGTLPRATGALSPGQQELVKDAITKKESKGDMVHILMSHFTYASFTRDMPAKGSRAEISGEDVGGLTLKWVDTFYGGDYVPHIQGDLTRAEEGSFYKGRKMVYDGIVNRNISYTISGHSHRAGIYAVVKGLGDSYMVGSILFSDDKPVNIGAQGLVIVCGASGSYPVVNLRGELNNMATDYPHGLFIDLPNNELHKISHSNKNGGLPKPRIAITLETMWFEDDAKIPGFNIYKESDKDGTFYCLPNKDWLDHAGAGNMAEMIRWIKIFPLFPGSNVDPGDLVSLILVPNPEMLKGAKRHIWQSNIKEYKAGLKDLGTNLKPSLFFASMRFNRPQNYIDQGYDVNSPWCFPVEVKGNYSSMHRKMGDKHVDTPKYKDYEVFTEFQK